MSIRRFMKRTGAVAVAASIALVLFTPGLEAQQFNSDNYITMPYGVLTFVATGGQHWSTLLGTATLFPKWEFTIGANLYRRDTETNTTDHFSYIAYVKYMVHENASKTGGWAIMGGTGMQPGYLSSGAVTHPLRTYWMSVPVSFPLFNKTLFWDIMPGFSENLDYGTEKRAAWGLTYSTRLALYKVIPQSAIVGEVFGTMGDAYSKPQFKFGVRWEPKESLVFAATYGAALDGSPGAGFEVGLMVFSPPFLKRGGN